MRQTWRWFGPSDPVSIADARQAGAEAIVTALHHVPAGDVWTAAEIERRQEEVGRLPSGAPSGLRWEVVESVFVSDDIKLQRGDWRAHIDAYKQSLRNLAAAGIRRVAYHFMPVLDWTRTDLAWPTHQGGLALRFDMTDLAAFDLHILRRPGAEADYPTETVEQAERRFADSDDAWRSRLTANLTAGLPGSGESWSLGSFRERLAMYDGVDDRTMRGHLVDFLSEIAPLADQLDMKLCYHPDDPPFPILGLPRFMSTERDFNDLFTAVDTASNGMTFCSGSLGARADNDLPGIAARLGDRIHFAHLRNVKRDADTIPAGFVEDEHLAGDTDMVAVIANLMAEETRRRATGDDDPIPMRPDHGHQILSDLDRTDSNPGYTAIGRLKGLAELRGVMTALRSHPTTDGRSGHG